MRPPRLEFTLAIAVILFTSAVPTLARFHPLPLAEKEGWVHFWWPVIAIFHFTPHRTASVSALPPRAQNHSPMGDLSSRLTPVRGVASVTVVPSVASPRGQRPGIAAEPVKCLPQCVIWRNR